MSGEEARGVSGGGGEVSIRGGRETDNAPRQVVLVMHIRPLVRHESDRFVFESIKIFFKYPYLYM